MIDRDNFSAAYQAARAELLARIDACEADDYETRAYVSGGVGRGLHAMYNDDLAASVAASSMREELVRRYSWAIPSEPALRVLAEHAPILEIGAGMGYWAYLLRKRGVDILAYDAHPPDTTFNFYHRRERYYPIDRTFRRNPWAPILHGRARKAKQLGRGRSLFLCWPPCGTPLAFNALRLYTGQTVIYIGEGGGGCTADDAFHALLARAWHVVDEVSIPQWSGIHDRLWVYRRGEER